MKRSLQLVCFYFVRINFSNINNFDKLRKPTVPDDLKNHKWSKIQIMPFSSIPLFSPSFVYCRLATRSYTILSNLLHFWQRYGCIKILFTYLIFSNLGKWYYSDELDLGEATINSTNKNSPHFLGSIKGGNWGWGCFLWIYWYQVVSRVDLSTCFWYGGQL